ncbi:MAG: GHMP kinase [Oligoflexia bacterium]|nr:MAG: GHMP kinase [Oligoflexia bacterium]
MIIVKAPLRISIGGGGTDLPSYYENYESTFISAAINKYIYISVHPIFISDIILKYSEMERVQSVDQIKHPIVREALRQTGINSAIEISSFADIPSGTGLGSSGTFTVALLKALYTFKNINHNSMSLAEDACRIEIEKLGAPIGKQDQYISSVGGLTRFHIDKKGHVTARPLEMSQHARVDLEEHLLLFFTGYSRSANDLLKEQDQQTKQATTKKSEAPPTNDMIENLHFTKDLGLQIGQALEKNDLPEFGRLMNVHWEHKKKRSQKMSSGKIDEWYDLAMKNGALGGKLIGAGGGGFLMFLADDKRHLRKVMREAGMIDVPFRFDNLGAQVVLHD